MDQMWSISPVVRVDPPRSSVMLRDQTSSLKDDKVTTTLLKVDGYKYVMYIVAMM